MTKSPGIQFSFSQIYAISKPIMLRFNSKLNCFSHPTQRTVAQSHKQSDRMRRAPPPNGSLFRASSHSPSFEKPFVLTATHTHRYCSYSKLTDNTHMCVPPCIVCALCVQGARAQTPESGTHTHTHMLSCYGAHRSRRRKTTAAAATLANICIQRAKQSAATRQRMTLFTCECVCECAMSSSAFHVCIACVCVCARTLHLGSQRHKYICTCTYECVCVCARVRGFTRAKATRNYIECFGADVIEGARDQNTRRPQARAVR